MNSTTSVRFFVNAGRVLLLLVLLALFGAWIRQLTGATLLGMAQQHLFHDATALALLGIGMFLRCVLARPQLVTDAAATYAG